MLKDGQPEGGATMASENATEADMSNHAVSGSGSERARLGKLLWEVNPRKAQEIEEQLREFIAEPDYPCVGAKSVLARNELDVLIACDLQSAWDDLRIHQRLLGWSWTYERDPTYLRSLAIVFERPLRLTEEEFESALWDRLQSLADKDHWRGQSYDKNVSPDPADPHFSLSFGGQAYFVVGLHPNSSRPARRFAYPALIFNLHDQFERLRADGRYSKIRSTVLERDRKIAGDINPMLQVHGDGSEARQYSGRVVPDDWKCPFDDKRSKS